ncbi:MAG: HlyD family efflux transporter periplasmic adaptor subunit [Lachnospiraceae bacterium]|nr:HlyD family efflux transporter periplasmic adaptor subunit [Lachnospiraceae bacterium]
MEKEENTVAETVEEKDKAEAVATETKATETKVAETKAAETKATDSDATNNKTADNKTANNKTADNNAVNDSDKESISDVDIININEEENKQKKSDNSKKQGMRKAPPKNTNDFIANQKKRKRRRLLIILLIVAAVIGLIVFWISNSVKKAKEALAGLSANTVQTAFVEKKTLYDSKDATGTLYALESRTITRSLQGSEQGGAKINAINVEVGDHVSVGDVLVEFSKENVEKSIEEAKEDIGTQKQLDALNAEDEQRKYVYSYESAATSMKDAAQNVDDALKALYEACDAYGDAKRARDEAKEKENWDDVKASYEAQVANAYQAEQQAQKAYDNAVKAQADGGQGSASSVANSLSEADSAYKKAQITAGDTVKKLQRQLNDSIDSLDDYIVYATIDGVVTEVNVSEGNTFVSGNVLTIQDDSGYKADVLVDEYDIPKVKKAYEEKKANGQNLEVVVKTDATGDKEFKGHVTLISPTSTTTTSFSSTSSGSGSSSGGTSSSGAANYKVSIELDEIDESFMIGMSAKVAIIVNQSPANSLCVPYNCVKQTDDGKYIVKVLDENGDKNTADDILPAGAVANEGRRSKDEVANNNGIVVEKEETSETKIEVTADKGKKGFSFGKSDEEPVEIGKRYREVEVEKIFDTDYYVAIVPKEEGSLKEGDEIIVVTDKSSGDDFMAMFGPM